MSDWKGEVGVGGAFRALNQILMGCAARERKNTPISKGGERTKLLLCEQETMGTEPTPPPHPPLPSVSQQFKSWEMLCLSEFLE